MNRVLNEKLEAIKGLLSEGGGVPVRAKPSRVLSDLSLNIDRVVDSVQLIGRALEVEGIKRRKGKSDISDKEWTALLALSKALNAVTRSLMTAKKEAEKATEIRGVEAIKKLDAIAPY